MNRRSFVRNVASVIAGVVASVYAPGVMRWKPGDDSWMPPIMANGVSADGGFFVPREYVVLIRNAMERCGYLEMPQHEPT